MLGFTNYEEVRLQANSTLVSLDTSFLIRLLGRSLPLHFEANTYYDSLLEKGIALAVSVVAIGEYLVGGSRDDIPFRQIRLLPYNLEEASLAAECAKLLFVQRKAGTLSISQRVIIPNDVKIFASAQQSGVRAIVTADAESQAIHAALKDAGLITFDWWHIASPLGEYLGEIDFPTV